MSEDTTIEERAGAAGGATAAPGQAESASEASERKLEEAPDTAEARGATRPPDDIEYDIVAALKTVYDPEIPVDIYELGLIYDIAVADSGDVKITMTLTTPMCPAAEVLPPEVEAKARAVEGVRSVELDLVWDPPWDMSMMSPAARLQLNI